MYYCYFPGIWSFGLVDSVDSVVNNLMFLQYLRPKAPVLEAFTRLISFHFIHDFMEDSAKRRDLILDSELDDGLGPRMLHNDLQNSRDKNKALGGVRRCGLEGRNHILKILKKL